MEVKINSPHSVRKVVRATNYINKGYPSKKRLKVKLITSLSVTPYDYFSKEISKFHPQKNGEAVGLCPYHSEKNPSFCVNLKKELYYCQACGESGKGIIQFHMKKYGLSFKQAIRDLEVSYGR